MRIYPWVNLFLHWLYFLFNLFYFVDTQLLSRCILFLHYHLRSRFEFFLSLLLIFWCLLHCLHLLEYQWIVDILIRLILWLYFIKLFIVTSLVVNIILLFKSILIFDHCRQQRFNLSISFGSENWYKHLFVFIWLLLHRTIRINDRFADYTIILTLI
jgi:hypothetical protein